MEIITSNKNQKIKDLQKLNKDSSFRKNKGVFVVEGIRMFVELPVDRVRQVILSESAWNRYKTELVNMGFNPEDESLVVVKDYIYESISQTKSPQGLMAVVACMSYTMENLLDATSVAEPPVYLVLESLQDPGNMGTIFRTAEAAGVTALIIGGASCDCYNPKVVRSTMGAIFRVPFIYVEDLVQTIQEMKASGVTIYGAHLQGESLYQGDFTKPVAFLIGNEGNGLSDEVADTADRLIRIPMKGKVESLNAAVSTAVLSYEVLRQREQK